MKKLAIAILLVALVLSSFVSCNKKATNSETIVEEDGKLYTIRVASNSEYRATALVKAAEILNAQLEAEGKLDRVAVEYVETSSIDNSMFIWSQEGNLPEIVERTNTRMFTYMDSGYTVDAKYILEDEAYMSKMPESLRTLLLTADGKYAGIPLDTEARVVTVYWPALRKLGWSDAQIQQWKEDARNGKVTMDDLVSLAKTLVDKGICEYGLLIYPSKNADWAYNYATWAHGQYPVTSDGKIVINRNDLISFYSFYRDLVQKGLIPYNWLSGDFNSTVAYKGIGEGRSFCYMGHIEIKSKIMGKCNVDSAYVDENFFTIPYPVVKLGDKPCSGVNPYYYGITTSSQKTPKMAEYTRRLLDCVLDKDIQLDLSLATSHIAITTDVLESEEYQADKYMADLAFLSEKDYLLKQNSFNENLGYIMDSQECFNAVQEAMLKANDPSARPISAIVDELIDSIVFNAGAENCVIIK